MLKRSTLALVISLLYLFASAQNEFKITGTVTDTLGEPLIYATVLLLEKSDSTMVEFSKTSLEGDFIFKNIEAGEYLIKTTYVGYIPKTIEASSLNGENLNLGRIGMLELAEELMTVVIKAAKAPIKMRGDTIEYDASTFQVPEGSTVEDLLKRLPGIEVEADGSIIADGKDVNTVTVDGKSFFGSSPQAATKNLPAEGIGKVQVFDTKSEQDEITGSTSEAEEKTMNLELKEEFKKGAFGKVIAGVGDKERKELKGNFNKFNKKIQFSLVGSANNTGRNGLSWDDYQDFMGSQAWSFGGDTDYGFGGGRGRYYFGGGGNSLENSIQSVFFNNNPTGGFPENYNGGLNFNYDHEKDKISAVYYYSQAGLKTETTSSKQRFYDAFTTQEDLIGAQDDISYAHRVEFEYSKEIDSLQTIKFTMNGARTNEANFNNETTTLDQDGVLSNIATVNNDIDTKGSLINGLLLYRKKFKKKGRSMGMNVSGLYTELEDDWTQNSEITFFKNGTDLDSISNIDQINNEIRDKVQIKANALYVEPLTKKIFWQTFYNYSNRIETGVRIVNDNIQNEELLNEDLTRSYENTIVLNRVGTSLRYSHDGVNVSLGLGYQDFNLSGDFRGGPNSNLSGIVDKQFTNLIPHFNFNFEPFSNSYFAFTFRRNAQEPSIENLQPVVNNLNPQYIRIGNPGLTPEISNLYELRFSKSYPLSGIRVNFNSSYTLYDNQFSTDEKVDSFFVTTVMPINIDGGSRITGFFGFSFPVIKNKITTRIRLRGDINDRVSLVNGVSNNTQTRTVSPYVRFSVTPIDEIGLYLTANLSFIETEYDINASQNQSIRNETYSVEFTAKTFAKLLFSANLNYKKFTNDRFNLKREIPILDLSLSRTFLKNNVGEVRLSLYDVFNRNIGFQSTDFFQSQNTNLSRYVLLSFTYNIRGVKSEAQKDSWW